MKKFLALVLSMIMAAGIAAPVAAQVDLDDATMDDQWAYTKINDDGSFELLVVMKMDVGDRGTANMMVKMLASDPSIMGDLMVSPKVQKNHKLGNCTLVTGKIDFGDELQAGTLTMCADSSDVYMVMGTERKTVESISKQMLEDGEPTAPKDYMDISGAL